MTVSYEFRFQRGSANRWAELNPTLGPGEPGVEVDTGLFKIGTGSTPWNDLEYFLTEPYVSGLVEVIIAETGGILVDPRIGDLGELTTTAKETIVAAINEVTSEVNALQIDVSSTPFYVPFGRPGNLITFIGPRMYFTDDVEFAGSTFSLTTAPTGSSAIFEILKNGVPIHSVSPAIAASGFVSSAGTLAGTTVFLGRTDYLQVQCLQIGSSAPGMDLSVLLKMIPA
jgi:Major tropism determinant N-terminal domain